MKKYIKLFYLSLTFLICISVSAQTGRPQSKIITDSIYSEILDAYRTYNIFLPQSYEMDKDKKYPILYLLHGVMDTNQGWTTRGHLKDVMDQLIASGEADEMIIVTPNAGGNIYAGEWNGYFNMPGWAYEDFFFKEFLVYIEKNYRVKGDKQNRAIAGLSMGGGGSTSYAQKHPDMFCAVYAMSALMNIPNVGGLPPQNPDDKMAILNKSVIENSCIKFIEEASDETKEMLRTVKWFVDCGDDDFLLDRNIEFIQAMHKADIPFQFRVRDGGHTWEYWHSALYISLPFISRTFSK
ncbi:MAG: esterase family protein [Fermentimonas sp.]|jgi:S-formylglutathione hydrolase FrmB|uniref:Esterase n=1 Tax=Fermentimonas caenicola TaxID=1562970 RepID=A0A098C176_9BACT|nr:esterase family protein [Fermentimonas sp.]MDI9624929.1 alpha/beta hydrolase-fold protein [Bacteroidota bacterium]TAH60414.1 MAG: esterase family protein [Fermentimonas caenicola]MBP6197079.1 esterase family protein [Fermentimonas sp.]MBP7104060.1 esterase family protein [Fermentimonas sp.]